MARARSPPGFWRRLAISCGCVPVYLPPDAADQFDALDGKSPTSRRPPSSAVSKGQRLSSGSGNDSRSAQQPQYRTSAPNLRAQDVSPAASRTSSHRGSANPSTMPRPQHHPRPQHQSLAANGAVQRRSANGGSPRSASGAYGGSPLRGRDGVASGVGGSGGPGKSRAGRQARAAAASGRPGDTTASGTDADGDADDYAAYGGATPPSPSGHTGMGPPRVSYSGGGGLGGPGGGGSGGLSLVGAGNGSSRPSSMDGSPRGPSAAGSRRGQRTSRPGGAASMRERAMAERASDPRALSLRRQMTGPQGPSNDGSSGGGGGDPAGLAAAAANGSGGSGGGGPSPSISGDGRGGAAVRRLPPPPRLVLASDAMSGHIPEDLLAAPGSGVHAHPAVSGAHAHPAASGASGTYVSDYYPSDTEAVMAESSYTPAGIYGAAAAAAVAAAAAAAVDGGWGQGSRGLNRELPSGGSFHGNAPLPAGSPSRGLNGGGLSGSGGGGGDAVRDQMNAALARMRINNSIPRGGGGRGAALHLQGVSAAVERDGARGVSGTALSCDASATGLGGAPSPSGTSYISPSGASRGLTAPSPSVPQSYLSFNAAQSPNAPPSPFNGIHINNSMPQPDSPGGGGGGGSYPGGGGGSGGSGPLTPISRQISTTGSGQRDLVARAGSNLNAATTPRGGSRFGGPGGGLGPGGLSGTALEFQLPSRTGSMTAGNMLPLMSTVMLASRKFAAAGARAGGDSSGGGGGMVGRMGSMSVAAREGSVLTREGSIMMAGPR